jgi:predicted phosphodiesterase
MPRVPALLALSGVLLAGCASQRATEQPFPLKIGLLADSQITSQSGHSDFHQRSKTADALVDVAIRPPALECVLAAEMLEVALQRLSEDVDGDRAGVDVILYLGDAANSGGRDEIDTALRILGEHRERTGTPVFIVIGNHDYLGAGNIVSTGIRFAMLNRVGRDENPPLTKYEVLKRFSEFNRANNELPASTGFHYEDNFEAVERNRELDHDTGLYLCGRLTYTPAGSAPVDILLLDSSDYQDAPDWSEAADWGFYGVIGAVSFKDEPGRVSQLGRLEEMAGSDPPAYRLLASHYPKDHLDRITFAKPGEVPLNLTTVMWDVTDAVVSIPTFTETLNQNLDRLIVPGKHNYWVSGHTHVPSMPKAERFSVGGMLGERYFRGVNVGSTTDYRAHVAIVERFVERRNTKIDGAIGTREIPLYQGDEALLMDLARAIGAYGRAHADDLMYLPMVERKDRWKKKLRGADPLYIGTLLGRDRDDLSVDERYWIDTGAMILGLSKAYREEGWGDDHTLAAARRLQEFMSSFVGRTGADRRDVIAGLGLLASGYECGAITYKFDFSPSSLSRLYEDP